MNRVTSGLSNFALLAGTLKTSANRLQKFYWWTGNSGTVQFIGIGDCSKKQLFNTEKEAAKITEKWGSFLKKWENTCLYIEHYNVLCM
jgi:hypothetical protein